jgi:hypothetical protein
MGGMKILLLLCAFFSVSMLAQEPVTNQTAIVHPGQLQIMGQADENGAFTAAPRTIDVLQPIYQVTNPDTRTQELLSGLLALATTAFGLWMRYQKLKNEAALVGTIQGVEEIRSNLQSTEKGKELDAKMVGILRRKQEATGAISVVEKLIEQHTGSTTTASQLKELL